MLSWRISIRKESPYPPRVKKNIEGVYTKTNSPKFRSTLYLKRKDKINICKWENHIFHINEKHEKNSQYQYIMNIDNLFKKIAFYLALIYLFSIILLTILKIMTPFGK